MKQPKIIKSLFSKNKMSYYIIIRGPLGIGKSTIGRALAKNLEGEYISIDKVLEDYGLDKSDPKEGCIPVKNFVEANDIIIPEVKAFLDRGKSVVIDGNFYHRKQIEDLVGKLKGYEHYAFTLKASLKVCIERDKERPRSYGEGAATAVHNLVSRFDYGENINTEKKSAEEVIEKILKVVKKK